jgi:hypothetical protein
LPPRRSAQRGGIVHPVQSPACVPAGAPEYSAATAVTTKGSDTRGIHELACIAPTCWRVANPGVTSHQHRPGWIIPDLGACSERNCRIYSRLLLDSQQTVSSEDKIDVRDHRPVETCARRRDLGRHPAAAVAVGYATYSGNAMSSRNSRRMTQSASCGMLSSLDA